MVKILQKRSFRVYSPRHDTRLLLGDSADHERSDSLRQIFRTFRRTRDTLAPVTLTTSDTPDSCTSWGATDIAGFGISGAGGDVSAVLDVPFGDIEFPSWGYAGAHEFTCVSVSCCWKLGSVALPSISGMLKE